MAPPKKKKKTPRAAAAKPRKKSGPRIIPPMNVTLIHPTTGEKIQGTLEVKPRIIGPGGG